MEYLIIALAALLFCFIVGLFLVSRKWKRVAGLEPRVLLTGGGTGGHVNPALAIAEGIKNREPDTRFLYVGVKAKAEAVIVRQAGYPLRFVWSEGFPGIRISPRFARFIVKLSVGIVQSLIILCRFNPRWIVATGGYVSAPMIFAALLLRLLGVASVKLFIHEQNSVPGQLNALLGRWVDRVLLTFPQTVSLFPRNGVVVGYPIRHSIVLKPKEEALANLAFSVPEGRYVIFAFGGSQGSRTINRSVVDALPHLLPYRDRLFVIHGTGLARTEAYDAAVDTERRLQSVLSPEERELLKGFYYRQDYFHNIADVYSISDLIVCRSGAGSLNEISSLGKPAILVPKANLPGDHQVMNARAMKWAGAAEVLFEDSVVENGEVLEKLEGSELANRIWRLLQEPERLGEMAGLSKEFLRRHANERILSELYEDRRYNNGIGVHAVPFKPLMSNQKLLQVLGSAWEKQGAAYNPLAVIGDEDDLTYYRHRSGGLLSHKAWQDVNLGVKLIGLTKYTEKISTLLHMLADRAPTTPVRRFFGGDFRQVGFIRRNIVQSLQIMDRFDTEMERHLFIAMEDPYFEVRSQACRAIAHFGRQLAGKESVLEVLLERLEDPCFEVVVEAVLALGEVGTDGRALEALLEMQEFHYWQGRDAALKGLRRLIERRVVSPSPEFLARANRFILTATDFKPHFSIKESYKNVQRCCQERLAADKARGDSTLLPEQNAMGK